MGEEDRAAATMEVEGVGEMDDKEVVALDDADMNPVV